MADPRAPPVLAQPAWQRSAASSSPSADRKASQPTFCSCRPCANDAPTIVRCGVFDCRCLTFSNRMRWGFAMIVVAPLATAAIISIILPSVLPYVTALAFPFLTVAAALVLSMACCGERRATAMDASGAVTRCAWGPNCCEFGCVGKTTTFGHRSRLVAGAVLLAVAGLAGIALVVSERKLDASDLTADDEDYLSLVVVYAYSLIFTIYCVCGAAIILFSLLICSERRLPLSVLEDRGFAGDNRVAMGVGSTEGQRTEGARGGEQVLIALSAAEGPPPPR